MKSATKDVMFSSLYYTFELSVPNVENKNKQQTANCPQLAQIRNKFRLPCKTEITDIKIQSV